MKAPTAGSVVTLHVLRCSLQGLALASESKSTSQSHQHGTESRFKRLCLTLLGKWKPDPPEIPNCTYHTNLRRHRPPAQQIWYGRYHTIPYHWYHTMSCLMPTIYNTIALLRTSVLLTDTIGESAGAGVVRFSNFDFEYGMVPYHTVPYHRFVLFLATRLACTISTCWNAAVDAASACHRVHLKIQKKKVNGQTWSRCVRTCMVCTPHLCNTILQSCIIQVSPKSTPARS